MIPSINICKQMLKITYHTYQKQCNLQKKGLFSELVHHWKKLYTFISVQPRWYKKFWKTVSIFLLDVSTRYGRVWDEFHRLHGGKHTTAYLFWDFIQGSYLVCRTKPNPNALFSSWRFTLSNARKLACIFAFICSRKSNNLCYIQYRDHHHHRL